MASASCDKILSFLLDNADHISLTVADVKTYYEFAGVFDLASERDVLQVLSRSIDVRQAPMPEHDDGDPNEEDVVITQTPNQLRSQ